MNMTRYLLLAPVLFASTLGQAIARESPDRFHEQPDVMIQRLYTIVVARNPLGISSDGFLETYTPYLSKRLVHTIRMNQLCESD